MLTWSRLAETYSIRVVLTQDGDQWVAQPTGEQGSHMISSLVKANGLLIIPEGVREVAAGEQMTTLILNT